MLIYPFVPMSEAINNNPPPKQIYYTVADTAERSVAWTEPYFDRVGAGMMVTASSPVYDRDDFLGVASRDITLKELSRSVLSEPAGSAGATALLLDRRGLTVSASSEVMEKEIDDVNQEAGEAVLFYRSHEGLAALGAGVGRSSSYGFANGMAERLIETAANTSDNTLRFSLDGREVTVTKLTMTGWFLVLSRAV